MFGENLQTLHRYNTEVVSDNLKVLVDPQDFQNLMEQYQELIKTKYIKAINTIVMFLVL